jgi:hypothetical protein
MFYRNTPYSQKRMTRSFQAAAANQKTAAEALNEMRGQENILEVKAEVVDTVQIADDVAVDDGNPKFHKGQWVWYTF